MNPILEKWLAERQAKEKQSREEFLIKQGLVDPSKTKTIFIDAKGKVVTEEEAEKIRDNGQYVTKTVAKEAIELTEEEFNQVLKYARPETLNNGEPTEHELLKKISRHTGIVSTILIIYVILSIILGLIIGSKLG